MSKIIDSLQKRFGTAAEAPAGSPAAVPSDRAARQQVHEQLADVYFQGPRNPGDESQAAFHAPTVVRVVDRSRSFFLPWVITLAAFALSTLTLISSKRIAIDVRIMDANAPAASPASPADSSAAPLSGSPRQVPEVIALSPSDFIFSGAALLRSSREKHQLVLTNSSVSGLAYAHAVFNPPLPGLGRRLYLEARGMRGGEKFEIVLKDANGNTSLNWKSIVPFEQGLTSEWQPFILDLEASKFFDPNAIQQLRLEFGTQRTGNGPDATILVRNLQWIPGEETAG